MRVLLFLLGILFLIIALIWVCSSIRNEDFVEWFIHRKPTDIIFSILLWIVSDGWMILGTMIHYTCVVIKKRRKAKKSRPGVCPILDEEAICKVGEAAKKMGMSFKELEKAFSDIQHTDPVGDAIKTIKEQMIQEEKEYYERMQKKMKYIMKDREVYSCWNCSAVCQPDDSEIMVAEEFDITTSDIRMYKYFNCPHCGRTIGVGKTMADISCKRLGHMVEDKKKWWQIW